VVAVSAIAVVVGMHDPGRLRTQVVAAGPLGWLIFGAVYALASLAPLPKTPLTVAAGALFGLAAGSVIVLAAATAGALLAFGIGRTVGRAGVDRLTGRRVARVQDLLERRGLTAVLIARLVPVIPFTALNYAGGATRLRLSHYTLGTVLGIIPATVAYVALGRYGTSPGSWQFGLSLAVLAALTVGGWAAVRLRERAGTQR
jgi:uncharacterized membrane protein YdjX (TVP38/TMEM64 family)